MAKPFTRLTPLSAKRVGARGVLVEYLQMKSLSSLGLLLFYLSVCSQASGQSGVSAPAGPRPQSPKISPAHQAQLAKYYGNLPLSFEANTGQADNSVKFFSRGSGYELYLTGEEAVLALRKGVCAGPAAGAGEPPSSTGWPGLRGSEAGCKQSAGVVRMRLAGASGAVVAPAGEEQLPGTVNYFVGNDPARWHSSVPTYAKVRYRGVYPGVDLVYYGNQRQLEYDFVVAPGIDPKPIRLQFAGTKRLRLAADGDLMVTTAGGAITFHKPLVYQLVDGRRKTIEGSFAVLARHTVGFRLGSYDREKPLVIDPVLAYSTYLGGSGKDGANAVAVDTAGNVYVAGTAASTDFPVTAGALQKTNNAAASKSSTAFIAKLNSSGTALVYATYLGGSGGDSVSGLAVDGSGYAYAAGTTSSKDFPVTQGAFQTTNHATSSNAFITKLNPAGSALVYSTYLGGSGNSSYFGYNVGDFGNGLVVDGSGNAFIFGAIFSSDFPITPGAFQTVNYTWGKGVASGFVSKLNPAGTALVYSTCLGGSRASGPFALALDGSGNAYIAGWTQAVDFPVTPGAFQTANHTRFGANAYITKLNSAGTALVYSTYLGGLGNTSGDLSARDYADGLAVDTSGNAYVVGYAISSDFPVTSGAFQTTNYATPNQDTNAFVTKLNPTGSALVYSTYLGGKVSAGASGVAVDGSGNAYIVGSTSDSDFPVTSGAFQTANGGSAIQASNAFLAKLNPTGKTLVYSTYLGGSAAIGPNSAGDSASAIAMDSSGNVYIAGTAHSTNFPVSQGAFQTVNHAVSGAANAFVAKLNLGATTPSIAPGGIVPAGSAAGTIQPGEWVSIYGTNLAASTVTWNQDFPVTLGGTTVTINGKQAYLWYVSPGQINLQAPDDTATGTVPVVVTTVSGSATANVTLAAYAPSFLLLDAKHVAGIILRSDGSGANGGGSYDIIGPTGTSLGYPTVAAKAGDIVELYGTGFGPTNPAVPAGQAFTGAAPTASVSLLINKVNVTPTFAGLSGAGLVQINLTIPSGLGTGDVSLMATVGGVQTSSNVVISLR